MKNLMWFIAVGVFGFWLLKSCGSANEGNSIKGNSSSDQSFIEKFSGDYFVGEWYPVKDEGIEKLSIKYDGENYIVNYKIKYSEGQEVIYQKKNSLLLISDVFFPIRYDKNSKHIIINALGMPWELYKK